ncbi:MAG: Rossmann-like and DUF2520 domain-containing protein [Dethiobacteria bacterium]|jgi:predicted short-subunit dehydrogenase-like oxidoreductase (DUF2520 family)
MKTISIIGAGNVGKVLGYALKEKGYRILAATAKTQASRETAARLLDCAVFDDPAKAAADAEIVFITTPDRLIEEVCEQMAARDAFKKGQLVLHTSGAHSSSVLLSASKEGAQVISFHPLQTFPGFEVGIRSLPGTYYAVEGDKEAYPVAEELVTALEGKMLSIPTEMKALYHAAACVACNYLSSLMDMAFLMYEPMGISAGQAMEALSPLIDSTLKNIKELGTEKALTGPIARGDLPTISAHLKQLKELIPDFLPLYKELGIYTAGLAVRKGTLQEEGQKALKKLLGG